MFVARTRQSLDLDHHLHHHTLLTVDLLAVNHHIRLGMFSTFAVIIIKLISAQ